MQGKLMPNNFIIYKDFYNYYNVIKYEFEYGILYDEEIVMKLFKTKLQSKKLPRAISQNIKSKVDQIPYHCLFETTKGPRFKSSLVNKNRYNFLADNWYDYVYSSYGQIVTNELDEIEIRKNLYTKIYEHNTNGLNKQLTEEEENITDVKDENYNEKSKRKIIDNFFNFYIYTHFEKRKMKEFNRLSSNKQILDMIDFFSKFTFLGSFGASLKKKMNENNYIGTNIFVRGNTSFYGLSQESIYRCLYAINENREIEIQIDNKTIKGFPIEVYYKRNTLHENNAFPFILIYRTDINSFESYSLYEGNRIMLKGKLTKEGNHITLKKKLIKQIKKKIQIEFYYNDIKENGELTDYILKRIQSRLWDKQILETVRKIPFDKTETKEFQSIYYPDNCKWKIKRCEYMVSENEYEAFCSWIDSFGEFAKIIKVEETTIEITKEFYDLIEINNKKSRNQNLLEDMEYSLFNPYNSETIKDLIDYNNFIIPKDKEKIIRYPLPQEIFWLNSILECFPNICKMFLNSYSNDNKLFEELKEIIQNIFSTTTYSTISILAHKAKKVNYEEVFNPFLVDRELLLHNKADIKEDSVKKYALLWDKIKKQELIQYKHMNDSKVIEAKRLFLYAFEYNVAAANTTRRNEPFLIMGYDMNQKRTVNLELESIDTRQEKSENFEKIGITVWDKLYCIIAFFIRVENIKNEISDENLYLNFKEDFSYKNERRIAKTPSEKLEIDKKIKLSEALKKLEALGVFKNNKRTFIELYEQVYTKCNQLSFIQEDIEECIINTFGYYYDYLLYDKKSKSNYEFDLKHHGISKVSDEEVEYKRKLLSCLQKIQENSLKNKGECKIVMKMISELDDNLVKKIILDNPYEFLKISKNSPKKNMENDVSISKIQEYLSKKIEIENEVNLKYETSKLNEIVYLNEKMKTASFSFKLKEKDISIQNIDKIYDAFREFNCVGKRIDTNEELEIQFTVYYERFNYRKIHMGILSLGKLIYDIEPEELNRLINKRKGYE